MTIAELCKPDANLTHNVCRARKDDAEIPARLEALARKDEHGLVAVEGRAEVDVAVERGECVRVDSDEQVERAGWRGARETWDAVDGFVHDLGVELSGAGQHGARYKVRQMMTGSGTRLDLGEHLVVPLCRRLEDRGESGLGNAAGAEEAVGPHRHAFLDAAGDVERVVQRDPAETPTGKEEAFGQAGEGDDGDGV